VQPVSVPSLPLSGTVEHGSGNVVSQALNTKITNIIKAHTLIGAVITNPQLHEFKTISTISPDHRIYVTYQTIVNNQIQKIDKFIFLTPDEYADLSKAIQAEAEDKYKQITPETTTPTITKINKLVAPLFKALKAGNTTLGIDRNTLNAAVGLMGLLLFLLAIIPGGLPIIALVGIGVGLAALTVALLIYKVTTNKMTPLQALVYGLVIFTMIACALSPIGPIALIVFKVAYGAIAFSQGFFFGLIRGILNSMDEFQKFKLAHRLSNASDDQAMNWTEILGLIGSFLSSTKGAGYMAMGILKIVSAALPGSTEIYTALFCASHVVYYLLNNASLLPKIITTSMDIQRLEKRAKILADLYDDTEKKDSCLKVLNSLKKSLIQKEDFSGDLQQAIEMGMINYRREKRANKSELFSLSEIENLIISVRKDDLTAIDRVCSWVSREKKIAQEELAQTCHLRKAHLLYLFLGTLFIMVGDLFAIHLFGDPIAKGIFPQQEQDFVGVSPTTGIEMTASEAFESSGQCFDSGFKGVFASDYNQEVQRYEKSENYWEVLQSKIKILAKYPAKKMQESSRHCCINSTKEEI
jgi:hypothetical protein